jgi:Spy/CpxP family protein refolding chaperone
MKTTRNTKSIVIAAIILIAGTTFAYAHGGWYNDDYGYGRHMGRCMMGPDCGSQMMERGYGGRMMGPNQCRNMMGPGWGRGHHRGYANLSDQDQAKIDAAREKFFDETRTLRRDIDDQAYALRKEMRKDNPDTAKVTQLQKQLSKLQDEFDLKAVQHRLEMRKLWQKPVRNQN